MNIEVNKNAPAYHEAKIEIHRTPIEVYKLLIDIKRWPFWQEDVKEVKVSAKVTAGTEFSRKLENTKIRSTIHTADPGKELGWTGSFYWMRTIHNWYLSQSGSSSTLVVVKESVTGLGSKFMQKKLVDTITRNLFELKIEAERTI